MKYNLAVIGGGPAGYSCALRGAQLGASVVLIEDKELGGTCLNRGCVPTKALYQIAKTLKEQEKCNKLGIEGEKLDEIKINTDKLLTFKNEKVNNLVDGIRTLLDNKKIDYKRGRGILKENNKITIEESDSGEVYDISSDYVVLATGSKPNEKIMGPELSTLCWSADDLVSTDDFWLSGGDSVTIIGGGVIGVELSSILAILGKKVSLIEVESRLLPPLDSDIKKRMSTYLKKLGVEVHTNSMVYDICTDKDSGSNKDIKKLKIRKKKKEFTLETEEVLLSVGREPNLTGIDVEKLGLETRNDYIVTDYSMKTSLENVFAAGDIVTRGPQLAHVATHQGKVAAENALINFTWQYQKESYYDDMAVPNCIFSFPQVGEVGLTEEECKAEDIPYKVGRFPFNANAKAMVMEEEGFVKIIANKVNDEVLGMHIMGPNAYDLIQEGTVAIKNRLTVQDLINTIHPHPTLSEAIWEASLDVYNDSLHKF